MQPVATTRLAPSPFCSNCHRPPYTCAALPLQVDQEPLQVALQLDNGHSDAVDCIRFAEGEGERKG